MIKEAIILAGGLGTRLRNIVADMPKPMAPVAKRPFLTYLLEFLNSQGITKVILSVGYKYEVIEQYFGSQYKNISLHYSVEKEPLGTGGAIKLALKKVSGNEFFIINGDSFIDVRLEDLYSFCVDMKSDFAIVLKEMINFNRYGTVELDGHVIHRFNEKKPVKKGWINSGVYFLKKDFFESFTFPEKFSFENGFLEKYYSEYDYFGYISDGYFIDIGIPEDFERAQKELPAKINFTA